MTNHDDMAWDDLHPATQRILSRRGFITSAGKGAAAVTFLGMTFSVIGCSKDEKAATTGGSTPGSGASGSSTTKAAGGSSTTNNMTSGTGKAGSLYEKLGGNAAITAVVGLFLENVLADDVIKARFAKTDGAALGKKLVDQIGEATGGPEKYTGLSMKEAHAGMKITMAEFNALVGDLDKALKTAKVPQDLIDQLEGALAPMSSDIVTA